MEIVDGQCMYAVGDVVMVQYDQGNPHWDGLGVITKTPHVHEVYKTAPHPNDCYIVRCSAQDGRTGGFERKDLRPATDLEAMEARLRGF